MRRDAAFVAKLLRNDKTHIRDTYATSKDMIGLARAVLDRLDDRYLVRLVDVSEPRLDAYFWRDLKIEELA